MGRVLNDALDNRIFRIFNRPTLEEVRRDDRAMRERIELVRRLSTDPAPDLPDLAHLLHLLLGGRRGDAAIEPVRLAREAVRRYAPATTPDRWGLKNPRIHLLADRFLEQLPDARFVYVLRHGLDMVYASNDRQVRKHGSLLSVAAARPPTPRDRLEFWIAALERIGDLGRIFGDRVLIARFEDLVERPEETSRRLLEFAGVPFRAGDLAALCDHVVVPDTVGRFRGRDLSWLEARHAEAVTRAGYGLS